MRYGICGPNLGEFADPRQVGELARRAEEAGWDGFFVWDHVVLPVPAQRPHPPVWIGGNWPNRRPLRRAARWNGVVPQIVSPDDGSWQPTPAAVAEIAAAVGEHRSGTGPFDVVITGRTRPDEPAEAQDITGAIAAAGATWGLEGFRPRPGEQDAARRRIEAGPPG